MEKTKYKNGESISYQKEYYEKNKEKKKLYYQNNKELKKAASAKWAKENKSKVSGYMAKYNKKRSKLDPVFKLRMSMRNRLYQFFKSQSVKKNKKTEEYLGCTYEEAKKHIENKFQDGMNWRNHGKWHIDHIKPLVLATCENDLIELCNYNNLQPLWAIDNLIKKDKF